MYGEIQDKSKIQVGSWVPFRKESEALERMGEYSVSISALHDLLYLLCFLCLLGLLVDISGCNPWKEIGYFPCPESLLGATFCVWC